MTIWGFLAVVAACYTAVVIVAFIYDRNTPD